MAAVTISMIKLMMNDVEAFVMKFHENLKEYYSKNEELKIKINALLNENSKLFSKNKD